MQYTFRSRVYPVYGNNIGTARRNALIEAFIRMYPQIGKEVRSGINYLDTMDSTGIDNKGLADMLENNVKMYLQEGLDSDITDPNEINMIETLVAVYDSVIADKGKEDEDITFFIVRLDGNNVAKVPVKFSATVGSIKSYFRNYLNKARRNSQDYQISIYLDKNNKLDIDNSEQYDDLIIGLVWNQIGQGYISLYKK